MAPCGWSAKSACRGSDAKWTESALYPSLCLRLFPALILSQRVLLSYVSVSVTRKGERENLRVLKLFRNKILGIE